MSRVRRLDAKRCLRRVTARPVAEIKSIRRRWLISRSLPSEQPIKWDYTVTDKVRLYESTVLSMFLYVQNI